VGRVCPRHSHRGWPLNSVVRTHLSTSDTIDQHLQSLEELLLQSGTRRDADQVGRLLTDDFVEIGSSGSAYTKSEIIAALAEETPVQWTMEHFKARAIAEGVVLVTYRATRHDQRTVTSLRSSVWKREGERWRMAFHQGTVAKD
jgi:hypothetical protein